MDGVYSEVKLDFSGTTLLANNMLTAQKATGIIRQNIGQVQRDLSHISRNFTLARMPGLSGSGTAGQTSADASARARGLAGLPAHAAGDRAALAGGTAAGAAFFYKATQLANPAATMRFNMALEDTVAVIGHQMIPALNTMTKGVRSLGDFLANHPTLTKAIGYGAAGLGLAAAAGTVYSIGSMAARGLRGAYNDTRGVFGYGGTAGVAADVASGLGGGMGPMGFGGGSMRSQRAAALTASYAAERSAQTRLNAAMAIERAAGGYGGHPEASRSAMQARADLAYLRTTQKDKALPPELPGESPGRSKIKTAANSIPFAMLAWVVGDAVQETIDENTKEPGKNQNALDRTLESVLPDSVKNFLTSVGLRNSGNDVSSFGAAARPAEYQDIIGSVMNMRQQIASGSLDPAERTAKAAEETSVSIDSIQKTIEDYLNEQRRGSELDERIRNRTTAGGK